MAVVIADRVFHARDDRAAAGQRRSEVLDALTTVTPRDRDDALRLLCASQSPVPYRGRKHELERLADWSIDDSACPVLMISGQAGVGKSRLALEFASSLPEKWAVGWLHPGKGAEAVTALRACGKPALMLVDNADGRADLIPLLDALAEHHSSPTTRVIMLTRSAIGLAVSLESRLDERHGWVAARAEQLDLQPHGGPDDWDRWFGEAVAAFAKVLDVPEPTIPARVPAAQHGTEQPILVLQAQALLAVLGTPVADESYDSLSPAQIAEALMRHEKRRWRATADTWDWGAGGPPTETVQERSVAALTLLGPTSADEAEQILRRISQLHDAPGERVSAIAAWISTLYGQGSDGGLRIVPDMVGEWFVVSQLGTHAEFAQGLRNGLTDSQATRALVFLAHAADRFDPATYLFEDFSSGDLHRLLLAASQAALTGEAGRHLLDPVVGGQIRSADGWTIDRLISIEGLIPQHLLLLTHVAIGNIMVQLCRASAKEGLAAHQAPLATALDNLGARLHKIGEYEDALAAGKESVDLLRALPKDNPNAHQESLATALDNLSGHLDRLGQYEDALAASKESVDLRRALAKDNPAARQESLATALYNLSVRLDQVGEYEDALAAGKESVDLLRALAEDDPSAHQAHFATALSGLASRLDGVGRYQAALAAAEESVALGRALVKDKLGAHRENFASALNNLGAHLDRLGQYEDALAAAEESVDLRRALVKDNPAAHQAELALALSNLAIRLDRVGRYQTALAAAEESVALYRALFKENPAALRANFASALNNLGSQLDRLDQYEDAMAATEESVALYRALFKENPATHQAGLALALNNLGVRLYRLGQYEDALAAVKESVDLRRALVKENPAAHQADLARELSNRATFLTRTERYQDGLADWTEATDIYRELALIDPNLYRNLYEQHLSALQQAYDQNGMRDRAILHHLEDSYELPPKHH